MVLHKRVGGVRPQPASPPSPAPHTIGKKSLARGLCEVLLFGLLTVGLMSGLLLSYGRRDGFAAWMGGSGDGIGNLLHPFHHPVDPTTLPTFGASAPDSATLETLEMEGNFLSFERWLEREHVLLRGVRFSPTAPSSRGYAWHEHGLVASHDIEPGEVLFSVPGTAILTEAHAFGDPILGAFIRYAVLNATLSLQLTSLSHTLAIYVMLLRAPTAESYKLQGDLDDYPLTWRHQVELTRELPYRAKWRPFIDFLLHTPCEYRSPHCWRETEWDAIRNTPAWHRHFHFAAKVVNDYNRLFLDEFSGLSTRYSEYFPKRYFTLELFRDVVLMLWEHLSDASPLDSWIELRGADGRPYYSNLITGLQQITPPTSFHDNLALALVPLVRMFRCQNEGFSTPQLREHVHTHLESNRANVHMDSLPRLRFEATKAHPYPEDTQPQRLQYFAEAHYKTSDEILVALPPTDLDAQFMVRGTVFADGPNFVSLRFPFDIGFVANACPTCVAKDILEMKQRLLSQHGLWYGQRFDVAHQYDDHIASPHAIAYLRVLAASPMEMGLRPGDIEPAVLRAIRNQPVSDGNEALVQNVLNTICRMGELQDVHGIAMKAWDALIPRKQTLVRTYLRVLYESMGIPQPPFGIR